MRKFLLGIFFALFILGVVYNFLCSLFKNFCLYITFYSYVFGADVVNWWVYVFIRSLLFFLYIFSLTDLIGFLNLNIHLIEMNLQSQ